MCHPQNEVRTSPVIRAGCWPDGTVWAHVDSGRFIVHALIYDASPHPLRAITHRTRDGHSMQVEYSPTGTYTIWIAP